MVARVPCFGLWCLALLGNTVLIGDPSGPTPIQGIKLTQHNIYSYRYRLMASAATALPLYNAETLEQFYT